MSEYNVSESFGEVKRCNFPGCNGIRSANGDCVFHAHVTDVTRRSAIALVLQRNPHFHDLVQEARRCQWFDPPRNREEWKVVYNCAKLLAKAEQLPPGIDLSDVERFKALVNRTEKLRVNGFVFGADWIGRQLEEIAIARVNFESQKILEAAAKDKDLEQRLNNEHDVKRTFVPSVYAGLNAMKMFSPGVERQ